ncbi:MAG: Uma2 family endonuclease [Labilithrix sp.]|nr:Uma2 family endonuclease [Labilithrix sp.]MCW5811342.1 Uma2 family endonuclease [Labilithrix sp.]
MSAASKTLATAETLLALGDEPFEVIGGELVRRADPSAEHGDAQGSLVASIRSRFHRGSGGPEGPGGWWILPEVDVELARHEIVRPDLGGWRRDRVPERPTGRPIRHRPDWMCEVLSAINARNDLVWKLDLYRRVEILHYWIVDPQTETLTVHRLTPDGYLIALRADRSATVRAEPFEAIELRVGALFGDE